MSPNLTGRKTLLLLTSIAISWFLFKGCSNGRLPPGSDLLKFDQIVWKTNKATITAQASVPTERQKMLKDVVQNVLPNKTREEIINLLGPSTETSHFKRMYDLIYVLGPERNGYRIDFEWLLIHLEKGKFKSYSIRVD